MRLASFSVTGMMVAALALAGCGGHHAQLHGGRVHSTQFLHQAQSAKFPAGRFSLAPSLPGYDAVTISAIPRGTAVVGCYVSGQYANCGTARADFPHARLVTIATYAAYPGPAKILDTEPGDATPDQDAGFIRRESTVYHVYRPGVYADASEMLQVRADLNADGLARTSYVLMVAAWDGSPTIPAGYDAKQYRSTATLDYDTFAVSFFLPAPKPGPSASQLTYWRGARNASFTAYHRNGCKVALKGRCGLLAHRVIYFQRKLWIASPRYSCFGARAQVHADVCWIVRPLANYYSHAAFSTQQAYTRNTCDGAQGLPTPSRSPLCDTLRQREHYFHQKATSLVRSYG